MRTLVFIFILITSKVSFGQTYLNDTTLFGGLVAIISSVYEVDSGYYLMGNRYAENHGNMSELVLGFTDSNGISIIQTDFDTLNIQNVYSSVGKLILNDRGNFVFRYKNCDTISCYPRIKEFTPDGNLVADVKFGYLLDSLNVAVVDYGDFMQKKDSTYVLTANTYFPTFGTSLYIHLDKDFNLLDTIHFIHPNPNWQYTNAEVIELESGYTFLGISELKLLPDDSGGIRFIIIDDNDIIIFEGEFLDTSKMNIPLGLCESHSTDGYLFTYIEEIDVNGDDRYYMKVAKVDINFNLVWKRNVDGTLIITPTQFLMQQEIKRVSDGNYVIGGSFWDSLVENSASLITKFNDQGDFIWQRWIHFGNAENVGIEIRDIIETNDGGFCMVGGITEFGPIVQKGYIVKTNCLGFLGEPIASSSHTVLDNFSVEFYNASMQDGGCTWYFGDGDSVWTDEYTDTISHVYPGFGSYEVMLIADGCNGSADTLIFTVEPVKHTDPTVVTNGNGYFSIFPNPVLAGAQMYVYLNELDASKGDVYLNIYSMNGKLVQEIPLTASEGTYFINNSLSTGMYLIGLFQGDDLLEKEKLIVNK